MGPEACATDPPRNNAPKARGRPFAMGNAGRPKGARHRVTLAAEALLDGEAAALSRKAVELALAGDTVALRLCLERILPTRRERPIEFALPALRSVTDAAAAIAAITGAVAAEELMPGEAVELAQLVETFVKAVESHEFEQRLRLLRNGRMRRDLERRLTAAEERQFGSRRVAAILRTIDALSDRELAEEILAESSSIFDPETLTDAELARLTIEFEARVARPALS